MLAIVSFLPFSQRSKSHNSSIPPFFFLFLTCVCACVSRERQHPTIAIAIAFSPAPPPWPGQHECHRCGDGHRWRGSTRGPWGDHRAANRCVACLHCLFCVSPLPSSSVCLNTVLTTSTILSRKQHSTLTHNPVGLPRYLHAIVSSLPFSQRSKSHHSGSSLR